MHHFKVDNNKNGTPELAGDLTALTVAREFGGSALRPSENLPREEIIRQAAHETFGVIEALKIDLSGYALVDIGAGADPRGFIVAARAGCESYIGVEPFHAEALRSSIPRSLEESRPYSLEAVRSLPRSQVLSEHALAAITRLDLPKDKPILFLIEYPQYAKGAYTQALVEQIVKQVGASGLVITRTARETQFLLARAGLIGRTVGWHEVFTPPR